MKIREFRLQRGIFIYKMGLSLTKEDFHLQNGTLGLQRGLSPCYSPLCHIVSYNYMFVITNLMIYINYFIIFVKYIF